jgi:hypothetical protein
MPVILKINPQKKVVHSTFFGVVTDREMLAHSETISSHAEFRPEFDEIIDLTMVSELRVTETAMKELATKESVFARLAKHVIIAPKDFSYERALELKRIAEATRPGLTVVRTAAEAYQLVGLR